MAVYLNNRFVNDEEALLHVGDLSMQRGYAVFDYFRAVNGMPLFMDDHLDRILASALAMHLTIRQTKTELETIILELLKRTNLPVAGIRMMYTGGYAPDYYNPAEPNLVITCNPLKLPTEADFKKGVSIITYPFQRNLPHIKSINYQMAVWLQPQLKEQQADDVLYFQNNIVTEFPRCNLFMVTADDKLITPVNNILFGITRKKILKLAEGMKQIEERDITVAEIYTAKELFFASSTKRILPIVTVNGKSVANGQLGKFTEQMFRKFLELEKKELQLLQV